MSEECRNKQEINRTEQILSLFWMLVALLVCLGSVKLQLGSFSEPGSGFLPFGAGLFLGVMAAVHLAQTTLERSEGGWPSPWTGVHWQKVILIIISLFLYTFLLSWLGYLLATFLLMVFFFTFLEKMSWWIVLSYSLTVIVISYLVFGIWLMVQFPRGILWAG